jgi:2-polyprenyl-6-methoxyphenol hydroxylase-like FAD-dependent oxidoreductase
MLKRLEVHFEKWLKSVSSMVYDYCVVGGGIVGLATAMKLLEMQPGARLVVLEKETGDQINRDCRR